ncbi:MAG: MOSC N-terminal beta barrel domain-containing protein [Alkalinema sp. CAN_BIN05]|nr:MOSC N-terminal beta barrel domain-containing protein [Alkalinema sp. CAN_BIN05]
MLNSISKLSRIAIFPIKSLDALNLKSAEILASGALKGDREFAIFDSDDRVVNAKRTEKIQSIRSQYDLESRTVILSISTLEPTMFHLDRDRESIEMWLSEYFGFVVHLKQNLELGFPDDPASPGPTVISMQTLQAVASWYSGMTLVEARNRFRTNLELDAQTAFWEDQLFGMADQLPEFTIGSTIFQAVNPCQRCIVPTRNSSSGHITAEFQKTFLKMRSQSLPETVERSRFNYFYRLAVNTRIKYPTNDSIKIGDECKTV